MADKNLSDDMVKLVQWTIVSIQRGAERVIATGNQMVTDNMSGEAFASWMIAEYLTSPFYVDASRDYAACLKKGGSPAECLLQAQKSYPGWTPISHAGEKYLRVYYNVADRWPQQSLHFEEKQLHRLTGIAEAIRDCCDKPLVQ